MPNIKDRWLALWGRFQPHPLVREGDKLSAISDALKHSSPAGGSASAARLILSEVKAQCERRRAADRTLEGKAISIVGFAAVVMGFAATFNEQALLKILWFGWLPAIVPALLLECFAILVGTAVLVGRNYDMPDALLYNHPDATGQDANVAPIAMALAQRWGLCEKDLEAGNAVRSTRFTLALWTFILGLFWTTGLAAADVITSQGVDAATGCAQGRRPQGPSALPRTHASIRNGRK